MSTKLKNELLDKSIIEFNKNNRARLLSLLEDTFKSYSPEKIHDLYWNQRKTDKFNSDLEVFYNFKLKLIQIFWNKWEDLDSVVGHYFNNSQLIEFTVDSIIAIIVDKNNELKELKPMLDEYGELDYNFQKKLRHYMINMVSVIGKPNKEQRSVINNILSIYSNTQIIAYYKNDTDDKIVLSQAKHLIAQIPRKLEYELMLRLYFYGDKSIFPSSYESYLHKNHISKKNIHFIFDTFTVWLWRWAQQQKSTKSVPEKLKIFCSQLMQFACKYNNVTKYTIKDFKNDKTSDINNAWQNFQVAANDSQKRIKENKVTGLWKSLIP